MLLSCSSVPSSCCGAAPDFLSLSLLVKELCAILLPESHSAATWPATWPATMLQQCNACIPAHLMVPVMSFGTCLRIHFAFALSDGFLVRCLSVAVTPHVTCFGFPAKHRIVLTLHNKPPSQQSSFLIPSIHLNASLSFSPSSFISPSHSTSPLHPIDRSAPCISDSCSFAPLPVSETHVALSEAENKLDK